MLSNCSSKWLKIIFTASYFWYSLRIISVVLCLYMNSFFMSFKKLFVNESVRPVRIWKWIVANRLVNKHGQSSFNSLIVTSCLLMFNLWRGIQSANCWACWDTFTSILKSNVEWSKNSFRNKSAAFASWPSLKSSCHFEQPAFEALYFFWSFRGMLSFHINSYQPVCFRVICIQALDAPL